MQLLITILAFAFSFTLATLFHEAGHMIAGRASHTATEEFGLGFGKTLWSRKRGATTFKINALPILAYVKIKGMESNYDAPDGFYTKGWWARLFTMVGGMLGNLLLAFVIFAIVFSTLGDPRASTVVGTVTPGSRAEAAQLQAGDNILSIGGAPMKDFTQISETIRANEGKQIAIAVDRHGVSTTILVTPALDATLGYVAIGYGPGFVRYNPFKAVWKALTFTGEYIWTYLKALPLLFTKRGVQSLMGPIGIARMTGEAAMGGFMSLLWLTGIISVAIGLTQLLPLPALDGGWVLFLLLEAITRRRIPPERQGTIQSIGLFVLLGLMFIVSIRDITGIFAR
ncbi:MAG: M50 family metallopeptidase [Caldisericota bacterium]|jgi:regulator of sigma E protease|nr:M50 family metallopeptidase [Caldisericota bacterium]